MNKIFTPEFCENYIFLDGEEPIYGEGEAYISFPTVFPLVELECCSTSALVDFADRLRWENGNHIPLSPQDYSDEWCEDGWYNFYITLNGFNDSHVDNCIVFTVNGSSADDEGVDYSIELDESEQLAIYNRMDKLCKEAWGKGCAELLAEAAEQIND